MAKFITLTMGNRKVRININSITYYYFSDFKKSTVVSFVGKDYCLVEETPEQIDDMLSERWNAFY